MSPARVLFVDDEPSIRLTLPEILKRHGFEVTVTATVSEALKAIHESRYDVLLADLNIGQPGDGFTVVSAMRRTQPHAVTIILTGYPAFETALEAIRSQVDDYAVKPANIEELIASIRENLEHHKPHRPLPTKQLSSILRDHQERIIQEWLALVKAEPDLAAVVVDDRARAGFLIQVLLDVSEYLEAGACLENGRMREALARYGRERRALGYSAAMLLKEAALARRVVLSTIQAHLLALDMSTLFSDMVRVDDCLDVHTRHGVEAFLEDAIAA